jgi:cytochrome c biogenesis protein CcdA
MGLDVPIIVSIVLSVFAPVHVLARFPLHLLSRATSSRGSLPGRRSCLLLSRDAGKSVLLGPATAVVRAERHIRIGL